MRRSRRSQRITATTWRYCCTGTCSRTAPRCTTWPSRLELTATSEDSRVLDALAHARAHKHLRDYLPERHADGRLVDISFTTLNWRKAVRDKNRPGVFVRKHFEAMVFTALAKELRTGDVAVAGSEEFADWSEQLLPWEDVEAKLGDYLVEVGLAEPGEAVAYGAVAFRQQLENKLSAAAGYPDSEGLVIDPETGIPSLNAHRYRGGSGPRRRRWSRRSKRGCWSAR
ncbi:hypothetical protein [Streptomyces sp. Tue6028]|uniref:hypothetical protein n=1 Tax=Streptomyces sp. Tue6028 TaxID=2036037 RepID=UPI003D748638